MVPMSSFRLRACHPAGDCFIQAQKNASIACMRRLRGSFFKLPTPKSQATRTAMVPLLGSRPRAAFTIIELLVVISTIGMLLSARIV